MKKFDYIDALRGWAILFVIMIHSAGYMNADMPRKIVKFVQTGHTGVQLFYVVSAFTLYLSFKHRVNKELFPIRNFFIRRFFRIAPMYYIAILYYLIQDGFGPRYWLGDETHISTSNILSNFMFLHGLNPYWVNSIVPGGWSVSIEMTFYLLLPFLFSRIKNINNAFIFFLMSLVFNSVFTTITTKYSPIENLIFWKNCLYFLLPNHLPVFGLGILMYFFIIEKQEILNIAALPLLIFSILVYLQLADINILNSLLPKHVFFSIAFLFWGFSLSKYKPILIVNPIIIYIGKISFSMYLLHFATMHLFSNIFKIEYTTNIIVDFIMKYMVLVFLTVLISTFFYKLIEIPFQKVGKRIIEKLERVATIQN